MLRKLRRRGRPPLCTLSKQKHTKHCRALNDEAARECGESRRGVKVGLLSHMKFAWRAERLFKLLCNLADPKQIISGGSNMGIWLRHGTYPSFWPRGLCLGGVRPGSCQASGNMGPGQSPQRVEHWSETGHSVMFYLRHEFSGTGHGKKEHLAATQGATQLRFICGTTSWTHQTLLL